MFGCAVTEWQFPYPQHLAARCGRLGDGRWRQSRGGFWPSAQEFGDLKLTNTYKHWRVQWFHRKEIKIVEWCWMQLWALLVTDVHSYCCSVWTTWFEMVPVSANRRCLWLLTTKCLIFLLWVHFVVPSDKESGGVQSDVFCIFLQGEIGPVTPRSPNDAVGSQILCKALCYEKDVSALQAQRTGTMTEWCKGDVIW